MGSFENAPLFHTSLAPQEYRYLLDKNGFEMLAYKLEGPDCMGHSGWLAQKR